MTWSVIFLNPAVQKELDVLPRDLRASSERITHLIQNFGLEPVREPYIRHLEGDLWEMRLRGATELPAACT
jgi:hypothetical protein